MNPGRQFSSIQDLLEGLLGAWLDESDSFMFSKPARNLVRELSVPATKAITQVVLSWLSENTRALRGNLTVRQYLDKELSVAFDPGDLFAVAVVLGFLTPIEALSSRHANYRDEAGVSFIGAFVAEAQRATASKFPQTASLQLEDLAMPWSDATVEILKTNPTLLGVVYAANLYGRTFGNAFASPAQIEASQRKRQQDMLKQIGL